MCMKERINVLSTEMDCITAKGSDVKSDCVSGKRVG